MVKAVRAEGLETCATLGLLKDGQAEQLKAAGLDYYNHNIDTAPEFYGEIITTRTQDDRLDTLGARARRRHPRLLRRHRRHGRDAPHPRGADRATGQHGPVSRIGADQQPGAGRRARRSTARSSSIRSSSCAPSPARASPCRRPWCGCPPAARRCRRAIQALCFFAGANSIFYGEKLLTTGNPDVEADRALFAKLGLRPMEVNDV